MTSITSSIVDFFNIGGGGKYAKFDTAGKTYAGKIVSISEPEPQTDFDSKQPIPGKFQVRVVLATEERSDDDPDDDGQRTVYVASGWMKGAIAEAVRAAGAKSPQVGGTLSVTYTGLVPNSRAKNYSATYTAPSGGADFLSPAGDSAPPNGIDPAAWKAMPAEARASVLASLGGAATPPF